MSLKHNGIVSIFQKGLTHDFHQKFKSSSDLYMTFNYILDEKKLSRLQKCQSKIV